MNPFLECYTRGRASVDWSERIANGQVPSAVMFLHPRILTKIPVRTVETTRLDH